MTNIMERIINQILLMKATETWGVGSGMIMSFAKDLAIETDLSIMRWKRMPRVSAKKIERGVEYHTDGQLSYLFELFPIVNLSNFKIRDRRPQILISYWNWSILTITIIFVAGSCCLFPDNVTRCLKFQFHPFVFLKPNLKLRFNHYYCKGMPQSNIDPEDHEINWVLIYA